MDVHHPKPTGEKTRHFKEYFTEFLMMFLAVTMGFIAENVREHFSDSSKERGYIVGMIKNLAVDTTNLKLTIQANKKQIIGIDTLRSISRNKLSEIKVQDSLYAYTIKYLFSISEFKNDDITISQLRNGGGYRLIRNEGVLDSIEVYETNIQYLELQSGYFLSSIGKTLDLSGTIFDSHVFTAGRRFQLSPSSTPMLITSDPQKIYEFYNKCFMISVSLKGYNQMLKSQLKYSIVLIAYLKKEYGIE